MEVTLIMNDPLISVIVPIYKVEEYLDRCITSIVNQTYKNLEIILVDDGSPDQCPQICDEWKEKDDRIIVIHKGNGGLSDARNAGLDIANGDYIGFVDSDDWISLDMYEKLLYVITEEKSDIVQCEFIKVDETYFESSNDTNYSVQSFDVHDALLSLIKENPLKQVVWNKLYKKAIFNSLRFEVGKLNEDDFFTYQAFSKCQKITSINKVCYYYLVRDSSIMGQTYNLKHLDGLQARILRYKFLKENFEDLACNDKKSLLFYLLYCYQKILTVCDEQDRRTGEIKIINYYEIIINDDVKMNLEKKENIWLILMKLSLKLTAKIRNILKINVN